MAVPSHNFVSGISDDPFNGTLIGIDIDVLVDDSIRAKILAKQFIHARYNNANKSWTELSVFNDDKPNLGFIRPVFSTTVEDGTTARSDDGGRIFILKPAEASAPLPELWPEHSISSATFYKCQPGYGG